jgi:hypothetical protein
MRIHNKERIDIITLSLSALEQHKSRKASDENHDVGIEKADE